MRHLAIACRKRLQTLDECRTGHANTSRLRIVAVDAPDRIRVADPDTDQTDRLLLQTPGLVVTDGPAAARGADAVFTILHII